MYGKSIQQRKMGNNGANRKNGKLIIIIIIMIMTKIVATYIVAVDWLNGDQLKRAKIVIVMSQLLNISTL